MISSRFLSENDVQVAADEMPRSDANDAWVVSVYRQLYDLLELQEDWDTYGSPSPELLAVKNATGLLKDLHQTGLAFPVPLIQGTSEGGVTVRWRTADREFGFEFGAGRSGEQTVFCVDRSTGQSWEGPLAAFSDRANEALYRLVVEP